MLLGKLTTPAIKIVQNGPFETTSITADYIIISTENFVIGNPSVSFQVRFINIVTENEKERPDIVLRQSIKMTSEELSNWGTDDSILLDIVAAKLGTTIVEKIHKDFHYTY